LYWRILRLRNVHPNSWQRALFFEGSLAIAAVLVLADLASAWLLIALPVVVAVVVKGNDVLVGWLRVERPAAPVFGATDAEIDPVDTADVVEPVDAVAGPALEPASEDDAEPNVRVLPNTPKSRAARGRPGAAAARAQVSGAHSVSRRRSQPKPGDAQGGH
jgi:hypothetical protein